jgi:alkylation response protein AidB-like acyl-CoA dehydrogenase
VNTPNGTIDEAEAAGLAAQLARDLPPAQTSPQRFLEEQFDRGLAWVHHRVGDGGLAADVKLQPAINHVIAQAGGPDPFEVNPIGHGMCGPTLAVWGTTEQRRMLRKLFSGEEIWCQLFSEPGAGSDLAGLATRARRDGEEWVVDGQKVWTTMAHRASYGLLIARTDPDAAKHAGLTAFVVDMSAPGVDVRPLFQMTGEAEFNEVFFDGVRLPADAILGGTGQGWNVALTTLMNERVSIGAIVPPRGSGPIAHLVEEFGRVHKNDPETADRHRDDVVRLWIRAEALRLFNIKLGQRRSGGDPGPEGSISKILAADLNKDIYSELLNVMGAEGMLYGEYEMIRPAVAHEYTTAQKAFLRSRANSIEGGTSEVMKNVVAERILGLPGDVRVDKGLPWKQIPRS